MERELHLVHSLNARFTKQSTASRTGALKYLHGPIKRLNQPFVSLKKANLNDRVKQTVNDEGAIEVS